MNWIRLLVCLSVVCAPVLGIAAQAEHELKAAESNVEKAAHEDPGFEGMASDPLTFDPDLALFTLLVFVILLVVLGKFAWGPIVQALEGREHTIADHIAQAERNHEQAKALLADYERKLASAANEVRELMEEARRDAERAKQDILAEAKAGADAERQRALREIDAATEGAIKTLAERSAEMAVDLAGKIMQSKLSTADHTRLIQEAMAKFPQSSAN
jgi:F-type H+-transporting ATPase subunit b